MRANGVSHGEDNHAYSQGNAYCELDLTSAVYHGYAVALIAWSDPGTKCAIKYHWLCQ